MTLLRKFWRKKDDKAAHELYLVLAGQARQPVFYRDGGVPDGLDGRFDMLALHLFLVLRRLSRDKGFAAETELAQQLFDVMFGDMDRSLREMGVGDLTVGKRIRAMTEAFYGRVSAYDSGLQAADDAQLADALARNLYRGNPPDAIKPARIADYMRRADQLLQSQSGEDLLAGRLSFPALPDFD